VIESKATGAPAIACYNYETKYMTRADDAEDNFTTKRINQGYGKDLWHRWCEEGSQGVHGECEWMHFADDRCVI
jgi:hypothetical protein